MTLLTGSAISVTTSAQQWRQIPEERRRATLNLLVAVLVAIVACAGAAFFLANGLEGALSPAEANEPTLTNPAVNPGTWDPNAPALPAEVVPTG